MPHNANRWLHMTVAEGRNRYRDLIAEACKLETESRFPAAS